MRADLVDFERLAHLNYIPLPGGEQAVHQPWRVAAAYLQQTYGPAFLDIDISFVRQLDRRKWHTLEQMITRGINSPLASSLGRLFDAVAALLGLRSDVLYEGQAAIELEMLAATETDRQEDFCYPCIIQQDRQPALLDTRPLFQAIVHDIQQHIPLPCIARRFHRSIVEVLAQACIMARAQTGLQVVALSGGVFQNRLLLELLQQRLRQLSFEVYINQRVPPNDGGLALGQLAVAAARLRALGKDARKDARSFTTG
jgi:hydrogenase maturation protein HypF